MGPSVPIAKLGELGKHGQELVSAPTSTVSYKNGMIWTNQWIAITVAQITFGSIKVGGTG